MDSTEFFGNKGNIWKGKSGVYCIEQPALSVAFKTPIYKVGYARNSLYTRMSDYRSAYGVVPFRIYRLLKFLLVFLVKGLVIIYLANKDCIDN